VASSGEKEWAGHQKTIYDLELTLGFRSLSWKNAIEPFARELSYSVFGRLSVPYGGRNHGRGCEAVGPYGWGAYTRGIAS